MIKGYWKGKPTESYNKEELIDIIVHLNELYLKALRVGHEDWLNG